DEDNDDDDDDDDDVTEIADDDVDRIAKYYEKESEDDDDDERKNMVPMTDDDANTSSQNHSMNTADFEKKKSDSDCSSSPDSNSILKQRATGQLLSPPPPPQSKNDNKDNDGDESSNKVSSFKNKNNNNNPNAESENNKIPTTMINGVVYDPNLVNTNDVVLGRCGPAQNNPGNVWFRRLVKCNQTLYATVPKHTKLLVARSIIHAVLDRKPVGGRFMTNGKDKNFGSQGNDGDKQDTEDPDVSKITTHDSHLSGPWKIITYDQAVAKASQALRDAANIRKGVCPPPSKEAWEIAQNASSIVKSDPDLNHIRPNLSKLTFLLVKTAGLALVADCKWEQSMVGVSTGQSMAGHATSSRPIILNSRGLPHGLPTMDSNSYRLPTMDSTSHGLPAMDPNSCRLPATDPISHGLPTMDSWWPSVSLPSGEKQQAAPQTTQAAAKPQSSPINPQVAEATTQAETSKPLSSSSLPSASGLVDVDGSSTINKEESNQSTPILSSLSGREDFEAQSDRVDRKSQDNSVPSNSQHMKSNDARSHIQLEKDRKREQSNAKDSRNQNDSNQHANGSDSRTLNQFKKDRERGLQNSNQYANANDGRNLRERKREREREPERQDGKHRTKSNNGSSRNLRNNKIYAIVERKSKRKSRCGKCKACTRNDCSKCKFCLDKPKFGGPGRSRQVCVKRVCPNPRIMEVTVKTSAKEKTPAKEMAPVNVPAKVKDTVKKSAKEKVPAKEMAPTKVPAIPKASATSAPPPPPPPPLILPNGAHYYHQILYGPKKKSQSEKNRNSHVMQQQHHEKVTPSPAQGINGAPQQKVKLQYTNGNSFPHKLYNLIEHASWNGHGDIVSWSEQGCAFIIHDHARLASELLGLHFTGNSENHVPFIRRIIDWNFLKISPCSIKYHSPGGLSFMHPFFRRGRTDNLSKITRMKGERTKDERMKDKEDSNRQPSVNEESAFNEEDGYDSESSGESLVF
ncbi:MAG: hypothetical protein ACI90V_008353, partial [Bacillariaceae sp.]